MACINGQTLDHHMIQALQTDWSFDDLLDLLEIKSVYASHADAAMRNMMPDEDKDKPKVPVSHPFSDAEWDALEE